MADSNFYKKYIANVKDFPTKGILFRDITPTLENPDVFGKLIKDLTLIAKKYCPDKIMCADARGFLIGSPLALRMKVPLVIARKVGKLPRPGKQKSYNLEYGKNILVISKNSIKEKEKILIVDDLLATGGSSMAMIEVALEEKAIPVACLFYIELTGFKASEEIKNRYKLDVHSIVKFIGK